jgi:hypothetical protein
MQKLPFFSTIIHTALDDKTPADAAGIKVEGKNKWLTIIQNASKKEVLS